MIKTKLFETEGTRLLQKYASKGDPAGASAPRRLPDRPRKASAWSGNHHSNLTIKKTVDKLNYRVRIQSEKPSHHIAGLFIFL
ncbi:hypothetical protein CMV16_06975 [Peribacillus simplex]|nr:hypothetical protein CMV16_06975 [Peribacillus simplex]